LSSLNKLGLEASGIVEAIGSKATTTLKIGDQVWLLLTPGTFSHGTYGEYILCEDNNVALKPSNLGNLI
jgi:NADPH:quinone reductase-like Zn-dependent oxidoreductase